MVMDCIYLCCCLVCELIADTMMEYCFWVDVVVGLGSCRGV